MADLSSARLHDQSNDTQSCQRSDQQRAKTGIPLSVVTRRAEPHLDPLWNGFSDFAPDVPFSTMNPTGIWSTEEKRAENHYQKSSQKR